jgi:hypothetical protein
MAKAMTKLVNGYYMESSRTGTLGSAEEIKDEWKQIEDTLNYSEKHGRSPHLNMVETWWKKGGSLERGELDKMRATTTFVMTHSDGFALFGDPDNNGRTQDHEHDWYAFWNANVGRPLGRGDRSDDGSWRREFQNGTVISNALGDQPISVSFPHVRVRASDDKIIMAGQKCTVNARDGEIFLKEDQAPNHEALSAGPPGGSSLKHGNRVE